MAKFEVGEIAEYFAEVDDRGEKASGWIDCQIVKYGGDYPHPHWIILIDGDHGPVNGGWRVEPQYLRKKQPPQELSSWEAIEKLTGWSPLKENEHVH